MSEDSDQETRAVSSTLATVLLITFTLVAGMTVMFFFFSMADQINEPVPEVQLDVSFDRESGEIVVTHEQGENVATDDIYLVADGRRVPLSNYTRRQELNAGESVSVPGSELGVGKRSTVELVYKSERTSAILASKPVPDVPAFAKTFYVDWANGKDNGKSPFKTIRAAVTAANDGQTIVVRPTGPYPGNVTLSKNVTITAHGATIDGSMTNASAAFTIPADSHAEPVVGGLTITDYGHGLTASGTHGAWTVRNLTVYSSQASVYAPDSTGTWVIRNATLDTNTHGVHADGSTGAWRILDSRISGMADSGEYGIYAPRSSGDWAVARTTINADGDGGGIGAWHSSGDVTIRHVDMNGFMSYYSLDAGYSTGDWRIVDLRIDWYWGGRVSGWHASGNWTIVNTYINADTIIAKWSTGDWTLRDVRFESTGGFNGAINARRAYGDWYIERSTIRGSDGSGIFAYEVYGEWVVANSTIANNNEWGIEAPGAEQTIQATVGMTFRNNGQGACTGNTNCSG